MLKIEDVSNNFFSKVICIELIYVPCWLRYAVFIVSQENISGVFMMIQLLHSIGVDEYEVGETAEIPVTNIQMVLPAPVVLKKRICIPAGSTTLQLMTQDVSIY